MIWNQFTIIIGPTVSSRIIEPRAKKGRTSKIGLNRLLDDSVPRHSLCLEDGQGDDV